MDKQFLNRALNKGFTLFELIVVLTILAIAALIALPYFVDFQNDARMSIIKNVEGAIRETSEIAHAKGLIEEVETGQITFGSNNIELGGGYVTGHWNNSWRYALNIGRTIGFTSRNNVCTQHTLCGVGFQNNFPGMPVNTGGFRGAVAIWPNGYRIADLCYAYYFNPEDGSQPSIGSVTSGC